MGRLGKLARDALQVAMVVVATVSGPRAQSVQTIPSGKTAEQVYKNIQVLKGVPADQVVPAMQFVAASLGVECDFCHLENAFEKDDKETKQTARKMMRMMFAINNDNFEGRREVTCYACHRGARKPVTTPVLPDEDLKLPDDHMRQTEAATSNLPTADQVLERYFEAIGGLERAARISSRIEKGNLIVGGGHFAVEIAAQAPSDRVTTIHFPGGDSVTGTNGQEGWLLTPGHPLRQMSSSEADAARMEAELFFPATLKQIFKQFRVREQEELSGTAVYVLTARADNGPATQLYFDQHSGLLVRALRFVETPLGRNPTQIDYGDYRDEDGVKTPFHWTISRPGGRFTIEIQEVKQNVPIPSDKFMKPPEVTSAQ